MGRILLFDVPLGEVHCDVCYEEFALPLEIIRDVFGEKIVCSRCKCEQMFDAARKRAIDAHRPAEKLAAPICECGFALDKCRAESCTPGAKATVNQGRLF